MDGLLIACSPAAHPDVRRWLTPNLAREAGFGGLRLLSTIDAEGSSSAAMAQYACMAVETGFARSVVCVFADAPVQHGAGGKSFPALVEGGELNTLYARSGGVGGVSAYALTAQLYLDRHSLPASVLGDVAISNRAWAALNPEALLREPLDHARYEMSAMVSSPLRVLDCAYPANGAGAFVVSDRSVAERGASPVRVAGYGQSHVRHDLAYVVSDDLETGARAAGRQALEMAQMDIGEIGAFELYDAFTIMSLMALEEYGVCGPGQAHALFASGATAPGGALPVSTGGGHTSGGYLQGITPILEAVRQAGGVAGRRQVGEPGR
ncbi:thiolase family protein, partial [Actinomycetospora sp. C-140]